MTDFDVFNGDADGICALQQLRLDDPRESRLITGVKRDISLLQQVDAQAGDQVTVLDISLDKNRADLERLLGQGAQVRYFDHHFAGDIPQHPGLEVHIDPTPDQGTCYLVDLSLAGRFRPWAVVGSYGDNFDGTADRLAATLNLDEGARGQLRELGILMNYNAYGSAIADLHLPPAELYQRIRPYQNPLDFIADDDAFALLQNGYREDMGKVESLRPELESEKHALYILPDAAWARRVSGVFANRLARQAPARAHAILTQLPTGDGYLVSVRAPLQQPQGADELCRSFPTGGGRKAAAGINLLPTSALDDFKQAFTRAF